jgi:hypothetical protein
MQRKRGYRGVNDPQREMSDGCKERRPEERQKGNTEKSSGAPKEHGEEIVREKEIAFAKSAGAQEDDAKGTGKKKIRIEKVFRTEVAREKEDRVEKVFVARSPSQKVSGEEGLLPDQIVRSS